MVVNRIDLSGVKDIFNNGSQESCNSESGWHTVLRAGDAKRVETVAEVVKKSDVAGKATIVVDQVYENCTSYDSQLYACVPYYQCNNGLVITDGAGLIDIRDDSGLLYPGDSKCPGFLDVCCHNPDFNAQTPSTVNYVPKCGQRNKDGLGVEIQGLNNYESQFGEWPHMCAILAEEVISPFAQVSRDSQPRNLYQCGGSLIAPGVVLTAAHCVEKFEEDPTTLKIRCGEWDTQNQTEPRPHQDRYVEALDIHPEFDRRNLKNNWAVLYTSQNFDLQAHIDTICLPHPKEVFEGESCFATGWGKDQFGAAGEYQVVLKEVELPIVPQEQCEAALKKTRLGSTFRLHESFICAGGGGGDGKDTCKGDGGSPLVCPSKIEPSRYVQAGIVAWGIGCGENQTPGVYASVAKAVCWIDNVVTKQLGQESGCFYSYFGLEFEDCVI